MTENTVATLEEKYNRIVSELEEIEVILRELYRELEEEGKELERIASSGKSLKYEELEVDISSYEAEERYKAKLAEELAAELNCTAGKPANE